MSASISELTRQEIPSPEQEHTSEFEAMNARAADLECVKLIRSGDETVRRMVELTTSPEQYARVSAMVAQEETKEAAMKTITTIQGHPIIEHEDASVTWGPCKADIDGDGIGPSHGDACYQRETSLRHAGKSLNADFDCYIVVPPAVIHGVKGIVLGCAALVTYQGKSAPAVVGDIGPHDKIGEISIALAHALGIPASPTTGGVPSGVSYLIRPGISADVHGVKYQLQAS